jgi:Fe-S cluster biogenesis protein NfuA
MGHENQLRPVIEKIIAELNLMLARDGGSLELSEITSGYIVRIRLKGLCPECADSMPPIGKGIERIIKEQVSEIKGVVIF